jgi:hypothetical protein
LPHLTAHTIEEHGEPRDWLQELDIEKSWERIDQMAVVKGLSRRKFECIIADSSPTKFPGNPRFNISKWTYPSGGLYLELGHLGRYIGVLEHIWLGSPSKVQTVEPPFIMAQATFFDSELAERAWQGLQRGIFTHVSPVLLLPTNEPTGPAILLRAGLTDVPSCENARVIRSWEE